MKIIKKLLLFTLLLSFAAGFAQDVDAQVNLQYLSKIEYKREVYNRILQTIRDNPDADELDKLYFNLAELSTEIDRNDPQKIASFFRQVLQYNRDFSYKDIVLYNIGYYSCKASVLQNGQARQRIGTNLSEVPDSLRYSEALFETSIRNYKRLLEEHPLSTYYHETAWRLAEIYHEIGMENSSRLTWLRAIDYYDIALLHKNSRFYYHSLSGKAWAFFALQEYEKALDLEFLLLNKLDSIPDFPDDQILISEAVDNIAWTFSSDQNLDFENSNAAMARLQLRLRKLNNPLHQKLVLFSVAQQLINKDEPQAALDFYDVIKELYPIVPETPLIIRSQIAIFRKYPSLAGSNQDAAYRINELKNLIITTFNPASEWFKKNNNNDITASVNFITEIMEAHEPAIFNRFLAEPNKDNYLSYRSMVIDFSGFKDFLNNQAIQKLTLFNKNLVYMSQRLAQGNNEPEAYIFAIKDLESYNEFYPDHPEKLGFEKNIFFCYEKLYDISQKDTLAWQSAALEKADSLYIAASHRYQEILQNDSEGESHQNELARVIFKRAELLLNRQEFAAAYDDYLAVSKLKADNELISDALRRSAEIALINDDFDNAEELLRQAMNFTTGFAQSDVYNNIIATISQKSNSLINQKKYNQAADEFLRLSHELSDNPQQSQKFISQAISIYEELGQDEKVRKLLDEIASLENLNQSVAIYQNTWQDADILEDYTRAITLREDFIDKYYGTNEAFRAKLQIIDIYENKLLQKEKAAQLFLSLYKDSSKFDLGRERPENIFLNALRIYQDLGDNQKCTQLTTEFAEKYPDYSLIDLNLTYSDTDDFSTSIRKLKKLKNNIKLLFAQEDYVSLRQDIEEFRHIAAALNVDSLKIDLSEDNLLLDKLMEYADFHKNLKNSISNIENTFLLKKPQDLIPITADTRWKEDLTDGENLVGKLLNQCDDYRNDILLILQQGEKFNLDSPDYTHAIWAVAAAYDHAYEAVDQQVRNFVVKSQQLNRPELEDNNYLQSELKRRIIAEGKGYSFQFQLQAARFYQNLLFQFYDNSNYSDLWTRKSLSRLNEWSIRDAGGALVRLDEKMLIAEESYASEEIERQYNEIFIEYQNRSYSSAQVKFSSFASSYLGNNLAYNALYFAGECFYNMGQFTKAVEIFEQVLDFGREKTPDALLRLGHCYNSTGNKKKAYAFWDRLIDEFPNHYLTDIVKLTYSNIKQQEAEHIAQTSSSTKKERNVTLKYRKHVQDFQQGKYKAARKGFESIFNRYPEHPLAYGSIFMAAESFFFDGFYKEANSLYSDILNLEGNKYINALYRLGQSAEKFNDFSLRDQYWQQIVDDYPDHYLANLISGGESAIKAERTISQPVTTVRKSVPQSAIRTDDAQYHYKKALMNFKYDNFPEAISAFEDFLSVYPNHRLAYNAKFLYAQAAQKLDLHEKALEIFNNLLPQAQANRPQVLLYIAESQLALNNITAARNTLDEIVTTYAGTFNAAQAYNMINKLPEVNENE